jgi:hypothetical protein
MKRCECPRGQVQKGWEGLYNDEEKLGMNHEPNKCKCKNDLKEYIRNGKKIWLCSCCMFDDKEIKK